MRPVLLRLLDAAPESCQAALAQRLPDLDV